MIDDSNGTNIEDLSPDEILSLLVEENNKMAIAVSSIALAVEAILAAMPEVSENLQEELKQLNSANQQIRNKMH